AGPSPVGPASCRPAVLIPALVPGRRTVGRDKPGPTTDRVKTPPRRIASHAWLSRLGADKWRHSFSTAKRPLLGQQLHHSPGTEHLDGPFEVVGLYRQGHFRTRPVEVTHEEAAVAEQPLLEIAKGVLDQGAACG